MPSQGFRSRGPHTATATRPPGRRTRVISRAAWAGSGTSIRPSRQSATSKLLSGSSIRSRSSTLVLTFESRSVSARAAAIRVMSTTTSEMTTSPSGATRAAAARPDAGRPGRELQVVAAQAQVKSGVLRALWNLPRGEERAPPRPLSRLRHRHPLDAQPPQPLAVTRPRARLGPPRNTSDGGATSHVPSSSSPAGGRSAAAPTDPAD